MRDLFKNLISLIQIIFVISTPIKNLSIFDELHECKSCPTLLSSPISNQTSPFFNPCWSYPKVEQLEDENIIDFLCVGAVDAELKLCEILTVNAYKLPQDFDSLNKNISEISTKSPEEVCKSFTNITDSTKFKTGKYAAVLNTVLKDESFCAKICGSITTKTKELCALLKYIYDVINDIKCAKEQVQNIVSVAEKVDKTIKTSTVTVKVDNKQPPTQQKEVSRENKELNLAPQLAPADPGTQITESQMPNNLPNAQSVDIIPKPEEVVKDGLKSPLKVESTTKDTKITLAMKPKIVTSENPEIKSQTPEEKKGSSLTDDDIPKLDVYDANEGNEGTSLDDDGDDDHAEPLKPQTADTEKHNKNPEPQMDQYDSSANKHTRTFDENEDSNFFTYFMFISVIFICGYIAYHNKQKILALVLEGRRDRSSRRRPNTSSYRKLNSNLEEAVTSKSGGSASNIIY